MGLPLDEKVEGIYQSVLKRNPGEVGFGGKGSAQMLLGPVLVKYPEFSEGEDHRAHL